MAEHNLAPQENDPWSLGSVEEERAAQEVRVAMLRALKFPRNTTRAVEKILNECTRLSLAEKATYIYTRGGSEVSGPSIRLAEVMAQNWGNLNFGLKELDQNQGQSDMLAYAWDLENNVYVQRGFKVRHIRETSRGNRDLTSQRDIYEMTANLGMRRVRACILQIIPGDVVEQAVQQCEDTIATEVGTTPDDIKKIIDTFGTLGVSVQQLEARIGRRIDAIRPAQVVHLRGVYNSITNGMADKVTFFPPIDVEDTTQSTGTAALKAAVQQQQPPSPSDTQQQKTALQGEGQAAAAPQDKTQQQTAQQQQQPPPPGPEPRKIMVPNKDGTRRPDWDAWAVKITEAINEATTELEIQNWLVENNDSISIAPKKTRDAIERAVDDRKKALAQGLFG